MVSAAFLVDATSGVGGVDSEPAAGDDGSTFAVGGLPVSARMVLRPCLPHAESAELAATS